MVATRRLVYASSFVFGKVLQLLALELVEVVVDSVDATVVLQKLRGGLVANAGHAGECCLTNRPSGPKSGNCAGVTP